MAEEKAKKTTGTATSEKTPAPEKKEADQAERQREQAVILYVLEPHRELDLSAQGLPAVTREGTSYSASDADRVQTIARRYRVNLRRETPGS